MNSRDNSKSNISLLNNKNFSKKDDWKSKLFEGSSDKNGPQKNSKLENQVSESSVKKTNEKKYENTTIDENKQQKDMNKKNDTLIDKGSTKDLSSTKDLKDNTPINPEKDTIYNLIKKVNTKYGDGCMMVLGDRSYKKFPSISTGSISLDYILGIGGIPRGRVVEMYGMEGSGKSTLAYTIIAEAQKAAAKQRRLLDAKKGKKDKSEEEELFPEYCAYIDMEHSLVPEYVTGLGVDINRLLFCQPSSGEEAFDLIEDLCSSGNISAIVVDSVAALVPKVEIEGGMDDLQMGVHAKMMSKGLRKSVLLLNTKTSLIFINQVRSKIGIIFGSPDVTTGGNALKFYSSTRLALKKTGIIKEGEQIIGSRVAITLVKSRTSAPSRTAEMDMIFGHGFSKLAEIFDLGVEKKVIDKAGSWYSYKDEKIGQGRANVLEFFRKNMTLANTIKRDIIGELKKQDEKIAETFAENLTNIVQSNEAEDNYDDDTDADTDTDDE